MATGKICLVIDLIGGTLSYYTHKNKGKDKADTITIASTKFLKMGLKDFTLADMLY